MVFSHSQLVETNNEWTPLNIAVDLPEDSFTLTIRPWIAGAGQLDIDDASLTVLGPARAGDRPAAPVSSDDLERLTAFAKLYGAVRYLHPADGSMNADWDAIALAGTELADRQSSTEDFRGALTRLFEPIAPTVQVYPTDAEPPPHPALSTPADRVVAYKDLGPGAIDKNRRSIYQRHRVDSLGEWRADSQGTFTIATFDARPMQAETIRLSVEVKAELEHQKACRQPGS